MLATTPWSSPISRHDNYHDYIPFRSSPLSPRSANARLYSREDENAMSKPLSPSRVRKHSDLPFSKRPIKANPLLQRQKGPEARAQRRKMFLQKVAQDRDDKRFADRGELLLRLDYKSERRRWEAEKEKNALTTYTDASELIDDDIVLSQASNSLPPMTQVSSMSMDQGSTDEQQEAELQRQREEQEMEELLALMDEGATQQSSRYGSDDEEYDGIFMELASQEQPRRGAAVSQHRESEEHDFVIVSREDEMDMSN